jgi:ATP-dependent Clp protease protease subunit
VDLVGRTVHLHGDVSQDTISIATRALWLMNAHDHTKPIELIVSSYGGDIDEAFGLHDVTRTITAPVHTTAMGMCMSAAPFLVAAGHKGQRWATSNTQFMLHTASLHVEGTMAEVKLAHKVTQERCERMDQLLAKYTNMPIQHWRKFTKSQMDHYFDAEQAIMWGIIDGIWEEK